MMSVVASLRETPKGKLLYYANLKDLTHQELAELTAHPQLSGFETGMLAIGKLLSDFSFSDSGRNDNSTSSINLKNKIDSSHELSAYIHSRQVEPRLVPRNESYANKREGLEEGELTPTPPRKQPTLNKDLEDGELTPTSPRMPNVSKSHKLSLGRDNTIKSLTPSSSSHNETPINSFSTWRSNTREEGELSPSPPPMSGFYDTHKTTESSGRRQRSFTESRVRFDETMCKPSECLVYDATSEKRSVYISKTSISAGDGARASTPTRRTFQETECEETECASDSETFVPRPDASLRKLRTARRRQFKVTAHGDGTRSVHGTKSKDTGRFYDAYGKNSARTYSADSTERDEIDSRENAAGDQRSKTYSDTEEDAWGDGSRGISRIQLKQAGSCKYLSLTGNY